MTATPRFEKRCFECGLSKPLTEFYRHPKMGDGYLGKCKTCAKADVRSNYRARHDEKREYDRLRSQLPERKASNLAAMRRGRANHPDKYVAMSSGCAFIAIEPSMAR